MNDLEKLLNSAISLNKKISEMLEESTYEDYDDLSGLKIDYEEQLLLLDEFKGILEKLEDVKRDIDYLNRPIVYTGFLQKNSRDRYETEYKEFTSGNCIEVLIYDDFYEKNRWVITSVEHNGKDYYLVGYSKIAIQGLKVRIRK
jgi:intergrase/recombinase